MGDNRVCKVKESMGRRAAGVTRLSGREAGAFDSEVGHIGDRWHGGVECGRLGE